MLATILGALKAGGALLLTPAGGIGAGLAVLVIGYILKKIDNKWVYNPIYGIFYGIGTIITTFFGGKFKYTKPLWNNIIEPFVVDLFDNIISAFRNGLFDGLHSDNK